MVRVGALLSIMALVGGCGGGTIESGGGDGGSRDAPTDGSGTPATDGTGPGTDSGAPATDGGTPPADGGTPPADSGAPATDSGMGWDGPADAGAAEDAAAGDDGGTAGEIITVNVTFYGYPDNDPPSKNIAYPQIHSEAGGTGTFEDPITMAVGTDSGWDPGTVMYILYYQKYLIVEDLCASCTGAWIDIWMESDASSGQAVIDCENNAPQGSMQVEVGPPPGRTVDPVPLFDPVTQTCNAH